MNIKQYKDVDHPFHLPGDIDLFTWSMPFLAEKVTEMLFNIIGRNEAFSPKTSKELDEIDFTKLVAKGPSQEDKYEVLRTKVKSIARLMKMFKNLRENSEMLLMLKDRAPDGKVPKGLLLEG